jgi:phage shock protein C
MNTATESNRRGLYRSRSGMICGVCKGIANYLDISVFWTRVVSALVVFFSGLWPVIIIYFLAALLMKPEPVMPIHTPEQQAFYDTYTTSRGVALNGLKRTYDGLERRLRRLEDHVTAKEYDWERRFRTGQ